MTDSSSTPKTIEIVQPIESGHGRPSGTQGGLLIDPEPDTPEVGTWWHVGPGVPERVWHERARLLRMPVEATAEGIQAWIEAHRAQLERLCSLYQGRRWDGSNHVGEWFDRDERDAVERELEESLLNLPRYWDADDYLTGDPHEVVERALRVGSIEQAAAEEVEAARDADVALDPGECEDAVRRLVESDLEGLQQLDVHDDEPADDEEIERRNKLARLLGENLS